jgi:hypothetical protein
VLVTAATLRADAAGYARRRIAAEDRGDLAAADRWERRERDARRLAAAAALREIGAVAA